MVVMVLDYVQLFVQHLVIVVLVDLHVMMKQHHHQLNELMESVFV